MFAPIQIVTDDNSQVLFTLFSLKNGISKQKGSLVFALEYPPFISSKPSLSTTRDDHLIPLLSHHDFIFKAQLTSLYMHPTDYSIHLYDKN